MKFEKQGKVQNRQSKPPNRVYWSIPRNTHGQKFMASQTLGNMGGDLTRLFWGGEEKKKRLRACTVQNLNLQPESRALKERDKNKYLIIAKAF